MAAKDVMNMNWQTVTKMMHFLGLNLSTILPPINPPNNIGIVSIPIARLVRRGEFVSSKTSHPTTIC